MTSTDDALLPFDTVCLVSHDSKTILHADGLAHAAPKLLPIGPAAERMTSLSNCAIPTGSSASPLLPRDLITLQHVASGHYLSNQTSAIALQPHAGAGASWEIGRTLAALGGAPLQTGEAVHVCSESSLLHLCSDTGGALHCDERPERWRLVRVAPSSTANAPSQLKVRDFVTLRPPEDAGSCIGAASGGGVRCLRTSAASTHAAGVWQIVHAPEEGTSGLAGSPTLHAGSTEVYLCHALSDSPLKLGEVSRSTTAPLPRAVRSGLLDVGGDDAARLSLHSATGGGSSDSGEPGGFHVHMNLMGNTSGAAVGIDDGSHIAIRVHLVGAGPTFVVSPGGGEEPLCWSEQGTTADGSPPSAPPLVLQAQKVSETDARQIRFLASCRRHLLQQSADTQIALERLIDFCVSKARCCRAHEAGIHLLVLDLLKSPDHESDGPLVASCYAVLTACARFYAPLAADLAASAHTFAMHLGSGVEAAAELLTTILSASREALLAVPDPAALAKYLIDAHKDGRLRRHTLLILLTALCGSDAAGTAEDGAGESFWVASHQSAIASILEAHIEDVLLRLVWSKAYMVGEESRIRACVKIPPADNATTLYTEDPPLLEDVSAPLRVLAAPDGTGALLTTALQNEETTASEDLKARTEMSLNLLASIRLLAALCEGRVLPPLGDGDPIHALVPFFGLIHLAASGTNVPPAVRGACVRLLHVSCVENLCAPVSERPQLWSVWADMPPAKPIHPIDLEDLALVKSMLLEQLEVASNAAVPSTPSTAVSFGQQLPLLLPLMRLFEHLVKSGQLKTPAEIEPPLRRVMNVLKACAARVAAPDTTAAIKPNFAIWTLGGEASRDEIVVCARWACKCLRAVMIMRQQNDVNTAVKAFRDGTLTASKSTNHQLKRLDASLKLASSSGPQDVEGDASASSAAATTPMLLPLLKLEDDELTSTVLHILAANAQRRRNLLQVGSSILPLLAPDSIDLHSKAALLLRSLDEATAAKPHASTKDGADDAAAKWYERVRSVLMDLHDLMITTTEPPPLPPMAAAVATYHKTSDRMAGAAERARDAARRDRRVKVLRSLRAHAPILSLLDQLPPAGPEDGDGSLVPLACSTLLPLMSGGGRDALKLLEECLPPLSRHASCPEALDCLTRILSGDRELCASCPPSAIRMILTLGLRHKRQPAHLLLVRTLIQQPTGGVLEKPRARVVSVLRSLAPAQLQHLLPIAPTSEAGLSTAYRMQAAELLCDCASGGYYDGGALCRTLCPIHSLVSTIIDGSASTDDDLRSAVLRLIIASHMDAEIRAGPLAESPSIHSLLDYLSERLNSVRAALNNNALITAALNAAFLTTAAIPFLHQFYHGVYRPLKASARLREVSILLSSRVSALVGALALPKDQDTEQAALLQGLRRAGQQLLLLLQRRGLGAAIATAGSVQALFSVPATPRDTSGAVLQAEDDLTLGVLPSPRPSAQSPLVALSLVEPDPTRSVEGAAVAGVAIARAAEAEAFAEAASAAETLAEKGAAAEASVQERWRELMSELSNAHAASYKCAEREALLESMRTQKGGRAAQSADSIGLLQALVRHSSRRLRALAASMPLTNASAEDAGAEANFGQLGEGSPSARTHLISVLDLLNSLVSVESHGGASPLAAQSLNGAGAMALLVSLLEAGDQLPYTILEPGLAIGLSALGPSTHNRAARAEIFGLLTAGGTAFSSLRTRLDALSKTLEVPAARRCTVILLRLLGSVCAGPHAGLQSRLCGGNGGGGGLLSDLCRWILRWEENPQPSYLPIITHAADALAAICDGPHHANVVAVCGSAVPGCAARLLATRHEPTLYPADAIRRHRASLASLLLAALGSDAGGSEASTRVARQLAQRGGPLDAATIRALLVNAHAAWCASDETSTTSSTSLDEFSPSMMRWYQPGYSTHRLEALAEGCAVYALVQRLCVLLPSLREEILPTPLGGTTSSSRSGSYFNTRLAAALSFFEVRVGRVAVANPFASDDGAPATVIVHFGIPEDLARLPLLSRERASHGAPFNTTFIQQSIALHSQVEHLRGLSYYTNLVHFTDHLWPLMLLQAILACLVGAAPLLNTPLAGERWPPPPPILTAAHLALSLVLASMYALQFGPSIISSRSATTGPSYSLTDGEEGSGSLRRHLTSLFLRLRLPQMPLVGALTTAGSARRGEGSTLSHLAFVFGAVRLLLSDGTMALLTLQLLCATLALNASPPLAAALPLIAAVACFPSVRRLIGILLTAAPALLTAITAAALLAFVIAALSANALTSACGDAGGPYACEDGFDCFGAVLEATMMAAGLREECAAARADVSVARAEGLPRFQLGVALLLPTLLLAWAFATIRLAHRRAASTSGSKGTGNNAASQAPLSVSSEPSPWHYCAWICRVLAAPDWARSPVETHTARCLSEGRGAEWLPAHLSRVGE